jgi:hypothetical protein
MRSIITPKHDIHDTITHHINDQPSQNLPIMDAMFSHNE